MSKIEIVVNDKTIKKQASLSIMCKVCSMVFSFISSPLILRCLGQEKYGVWVSLLSIVSWIYYFDLGVGGGLQNKLASSLATEEEENAYKLVGSAYASLSIVVVFLYIIGLIIINLLDITTLFDFGGVNENIEQILIIALAFACLNFVGQLVNNVLYALQQAALVSLFSLIPQILNILCLIIYLRTGISTIFWVAIAQGVANFIKNMVSTGYVLKKYPGFKHSFKCIELKYAKEVAYFGIQIFAINVAALILNTTDNLLISKYFGPKEVTPYSFCYNIFGVLQSFFVIAVSPIFTAYPAAYAKKDEKWIKDAFKKVSIVWGGFSVILIFAIFMFETVAEIWLGEKLVYQKGLIALCAVYFILLMLGHITSSIVNGTFQTKRIIIPTLLQGIVNIPASILFAVKLEMGVCGIILGSIVSMLVGLICGARVTFDTIKKLERV